MLGVLIADDSPEIRSIVRTFLESATSFKVCREAGDATVAIERAQQLKPDVILLDLIMPELKWYPSSVSPQTVATAVQDYSVFLPSRNLWQVSECGWCRRCTF
jgi:DNA-binding NarL/FixJ family response regulator